MSELARITAFLRIADEGASTSVQPFELGVAFFNDQHPKGLKAFNSFLLIECKNWSSTVGSVEVGAFISKGCGI